MKIPTTLFGFFITLVSTDLAADVSLLIHETTVVSRPFRSLGGIVTQNGHAAVELHNACLVDNDPTHLKLCDTSDSHHGVVIGQYLNVLPEQYQWVAIPTNYYLYGVPDESQKPLIATEQISRAIERNGFDLFFADITTLKPDYAAPEDWRWRWRLAFGQSLKREIYKLTVRTSVEEDLELISFLNESENIGPSLIRAVTNNCSDFTQNILRHILGPDTARRSFANGLNSPKGVAERILKTTRHDPERALRIDKVFQIPGHSQSLRVDNARATFLKSFVFYQTLVADIPLAVLALGAYWSTSRFDLHKQFIQNTHTKPNRPVETKKQWKERDKTFKAIMAKQTKCHSEKPFAPFRNYGVQIDNDGSLRLLGTESQPLETDFSGVSASSDSQSFCLLAAHVKWQLEARSNNKPLRREFEPTWQLFLRQADRAETTGESLPDEDPLA